MTTTTGQRTPIALVALLSLALLINYVDRGSIGIAAPLIQTEFHLSASQMGWVLAAFFWAYAPMQPFMGWLADRIGAERVLVSGFCIWSIATVLTGLATGFAMLFAFRLLMGRANPSRTRRQQSCSPRMWSRGIAHDRWGRLCSVPSSA
jgi:MFS family permease